MTLRIPVVAVVNGYLLLLRPLRLFSVPSRRVDTLKRCSIISLRKTAMNKQIFIAVTLIAALIAGGRAARAEDSTTNEARAFQYYKQAIELHYQGDMAAAIELYGNAVLLDSDVAAYHADLGEAFRTIGNFRLAIVELKRAVELEPDMADAYTTLGVVYDSQNLLVKAIEYHRAALKINPNHVVAMNNLGQVYDRLGLTSAAAAMYDKSIQTDPEFAPGYDNMGMVLVRVGDAEKGIGMIRQAIELSDPRDARIALYYNDLGMAYILTNDLATAKEYFDKALEIQPDNQSIRNNMEYLKSLR